MHKNADVDGKTGDYIPSGYWLFNIALEFHHS
jgi:hypothetical protein